MVFNSVAIQLLHTILAEQAEWESRCFIETEAECVNESLRWQSTTLYNTDNTFWDDKQAYTASMTVADISSLCLYKIRTCSVRSQTSNRCEWMLKQKMSCTMSFVRQFTRNKDHFLLF
jgi:hypothetical protein